MKITTIRSGQAAPARSSRVIPYYVGHFLIYLGCLMVVLTLGWLGLKAQRIYTSYRITGRHLATLEALLAADPAVALDPDPALLVESARGAAAGFEALYQEAQPFVPLMPYLGWVSRYGGDLQIAPRLLLTGRDLGRAGLILADSLAAAFEPPSDPGQETRLSRLVLSLAQAKADLEQTERLLRRDQLLMAEVDSQRLSPALARWVNQLRQYLPQVVSGLAVAKELPGLLGADSPRTYLILTQNSDELRPTGGYINTAGHVVFDQGKLVEFVMRDSYAVDHLSKDYPYPPYPLYQYMAADYWVLRDAGWSPDFPTAARTAMRLYQLGQGVSSEGVIAFDQQALPYLLRALEPVQVEGDPVTGDNVIQLMRQHWGPKRGEELNQAWWLQRKSFMLALAETLRQKFEQEPQAVNLPILGRSLAQALDEKHVLLYLEEPFWADFLHKKNWAGSLQPASGDYLMVVEANLGFNKANALVEQQVNYQVSLAKDGSAQARANLVYHHSAQKRVDLCQPETRYDPVYEQNMERCYWDYLRLIVPAQAHLLRGPNVVVGGQHLLRGQATTGQIDMEALPEDKLSWGQLFLLAPQQTISLDFIYTLPPGTAHWVEDHWEYNLYLQKQPGVLASTTAVTVTLPEGSHFLGSQLTPLRQQGTEITYQVDLKTDQEIQILYALP